MSRSPLELVEHVAQSHAARLDLDCPEGWTYVLLYATLGAGGYFTCLSDLSRPAMITVLREYADSLERLEEPAP